MANGSRRHAVEPGEDMKDTTDAGHDPTGRFTGLANLYARARPGYPAAAIDFILQRCGLQSGSVLVDVGCGTGISSRLFASRGLKVIGIEPNEDMRRQAEEAHATDHPTLEYRPGRAERTALPDGVSDAVLAATAFHWFDQDTALREFHRILKPGGWTVLMWNERDNNDPFSVGYGSSLAATPRGASIQQQRLAAGYALLRHPLFADGCRDLFNHEQPLDEEGLISRALSASYAPREPEAAARFTAGLRDLFARFQINGTVVLRYETSVFTGRATLT